MASTSTFDTDSEAYFAEYLDEAKHRWERHPIIPGQTKVPDFSFDHSGVQVLCELKERTPSDEEMDEWQRERDAVAASERKSHARGFDPIQHIRHLINEGRRKFKTYDGHLCALIIYNRDHRDVRLDPTTIFGAMLGDPGCQVHLNCESGIVDVGSLRSGFLPRGGAFIRNYKPLSPSRSLRNISAVVALKPYRVPNPHFIQVRDEQFERESDRLGRVLTRDERLAVISRLFFDLEMKATLADAWGLTVCTNPFANIHFPEDIFNGPFDERWSMVGNELTRLFAGEQRLALDEPDDDIA